MRPRRLCASYAKHSQVAVPTSPSTRGRGRMHVHTRFCATRVRARPPESRDGEAVRHLHPTYMHVIRSSCHPPTHPIAVPRACSLRSSATLAALLLSAASTVQDDGSNSFFLRRFYSGYRRADIQAGPALSSKGGAQPPDVTLVLAHARTSRPARRRRRCCDAHDVGRSQARLRAGGRAMT
ncbi:hypothetical protein GY45DRAFT_140261 [Cubamyces sp. BRFM 1775]|nr:hypothetical protein GY45DRAFT_140261 [Cubamyces sp. BRFM 1775]